MMLLQQYLNRTGTLGVELLALRYAVTGKRHPEYPNLVQFKYSQIDSPMDDPMVQECRGVILDEANHWAVVARPFDKFFNYGEGHAAEIDWTTAKVQEKLDGSLCILYHYAGRWHVATSGTPDAGGNCHGFSFSFRELFWRTFETQGLAAAEIGGLTNFTFMFELTSQYNRVVVAHETPALTLIGIRHKDGTEYPPECWLNPGFPIATTYDFIAIAAIEESFQSFQPTSQEGYVVCDAAFHRVKVKHPGYVALHHLKDGFGTRRMVEIVRQGEISEIVVHFPEYRKEFEDIKNRFDVMADGLELGYLLTKKIEGQKEFALAVKPCPCPDALFALRAGHVKTVREYFRDKYHIDNLMKLLELK